MQYSAAAGSSSPSSSEGGQHRGNYEHQYKDAGQNQKNDKKKKYLQYAAAAAGAAGFGAAVAAGIDAAMNSTGPSHNNEHQQQNPNGGVSASFVGNPSTHAYATHGGPGVAASAPPAAMMATATAVAAGSGTHPNAFSSTPGNENSASSHHHGVPLQFSVRAQGLKNVERGGTSDPFAALTLLAEGSGLAKPRVIGKTETIKNTLSPDWTTVLSLPAGITFILGRPMHVAVDIYDDNFSKRDKLMGRAIFDIGEVMGKPGNTMGKRLKEGGTIFLAVEKDMTKQQESGAAPNSSVASGYLTLQLRGSKLKDVEWGFGKSDPFFEISRATSVATKTWSSPVRGWDNVYRSAHISDNLNPSWKEAKIGLDSLCNGNLDRPLKIDVYDHNKSGKHKLIGSISSDLTARHLSQLPSGSALPLKNHGKKTGDVVVAKATLELTAPQSSIAHTMGTMALGGADAKITGETPNTSRIPSPYAPASNVPPTAMSGGGMPTFVDYLSGGCEINLVVAIDFTGSNGDPRVPGTLHHYTRDGSLNQYEKAIDAIGSILAKYDSNQLFPVLGFGAKYGGVVRHCFQVGPTEEVRGVDGILHVYRQTFSSGLVMSGPTVFTEVIRTAAAQARSAQDGAKEQGRQVYTVLLILTDGAVSDVMATKRALDAAGDSPLSVVIVGIGGADFAAMRFLDGDDHMQSIRYGSHGRDIAQFVRFNDFGHDRNSLTMATLAEIPDQLVTYFYGRGIMPGARRDLNVPVSDYSSEDEIDLSLDFSGAGGGEDEEIVVNGGGHYKPATLW